MGVLSDFFIAEKGAIPNYDGGTAFPSENRCQFKSITPLEAAGIMEVLTGSDTFEVLDQFTLLTPQDAEDWTMAVPEEMVEALAALEDSQIPDVAKRCADITAEELGWSPDDFQRVVSPLRDLARRALEKNNSMYLWNSL
jgi:hypothetical protein